MAVQQQIPEAVNKFRMLSGLVGRLVDIFRHVVEFEFSRLFRANVSLNQFPIALQDSLFAALFTELPVQKVVLRLLARTS